MNQISYIQIADLTTAQFLSESEGAIDIANKTLSNIYVELVNVRTWMIATGKSHEYDVWIKKFKQKNPHLNGLIANNLWMEETE